MDDNATPDTRTTLPIAQRMATVAEDGGTGLVLPHPPLTPIGTPVSGIAYQTPDGGTTGGASAGGDEGFTLQTPYGGTTGGATASDDAIFTPVETSTIANASDSGALAAAADAGNESESGVLSQIAQSAASGGVAQPLGPQESLQDVAVTSATTAPASSSNEGVLVVGVLIVGAIAYYFWHKKHKAKA